MPPGRWKPPEAGRAPKAVKDILREVYVSFRDRHPSSDQGTKVLGARIAWSAVKKAGWRKLKTGRWKKEGSGA